MFSFFTPSIGYDQSAVMHTTLVSKLEHYITIGAIASQSFVTREQIQLVSPLPKTKNVLNWMRFSTQLT